MEANYLPESRIVVVFCDTPNFDAALEAAAAEVRKKRPGVVMHIIHDGGHATTETKGTTYMYCFTVERHVQR